MLLQQWQQYLLFSVCREPRQIRLLITTPPGNSGQHTPAPELAAPLPNQGPLPRGKGHEKLPHQQLRKGEAVLFLDCQFIVEPVLTCLSSVWGYQELPLLSFVNPPLHFYKLWPGPFSAWKCRTELLTPYAQLKHLSFWILEPSCKQRCPYYSRFTHTCCILYWSLSIVIALYRNIWLPVIYIAFLC